MTDAISREAVLKQIGKLPLSWEYGQAVTDCWEIVRQSPALDVAPVVHAAWIPVCEMWDDGIEADEEWYVKCSRCGRSNYNVDVFRVMDGDLSKVKQDFPYCHCGARMDGEP